MSSNYVDVDVLKKSISLQGTDFADEDIENTIAAVSEWIDGETDRTFNAADTSEPDDETLDETRLFTPGDSRYAAIDDITTVRSVLIDRGDGTYSEEWELDTDYQLQPLNAAAKNVPYTTIAAKPGRSFPCQLGSLKVTGRYGWPATPAGIVEATSILTSKYLVRKRDAPMGVVVAGMEVGAIARIGGSDPDVRALLVRLSRRQDIVSVRVG